LYGLLTTSPFLPTPEQHRYTFKTRQSFTLSFIYS